MIKTTTLDKERWLDIADYVLEIGATFAIILRRENYEGKGEHDARELQADMMCAAAAIRYVAEFASDKCVFAANVEE